MVLPGVAAAAFGCQARAKLPPRPWDRAAYLEAVGRAPMVVGLAAQTGASYALLSTGEVERWGAGSPAPFPVRGVAHAVQIAASRYRACALLADGTVSCWGGNVWGETVPDDPREQFDDPTPVPRIQDAEEIAMAEHFMCARLASGRVDCWGLLDRLGPGSCVPPFDPPRVRHAVYWHPTAVDDATRIAAGRGFVCALRRGGRVSCWGHGGAVPWSPAVGEPQDIGLTGVTRIAGARDLACAWRVDGEASCWGSAGAHHSDHAAPRSRLDDAVGIVAQKEQHCAWYDDGHVGCVGWSETGAEEEAWTDGLGSGVVEMVASDEHTCARYADGVVRCLGRDTLGEVGDSLAVRLRPTYVAEGGTAVFARGNHTCLRGRDGVRCWGVLYGRDDLDRPPPRASLLGLQPLRVEIGYGDGYAEFGCLLLAGGEVRCFSGPKWREHFPGPAVDVSVNEGRACSALGNGELWCLSVVEGKGAPLRIPLNDGSSVAQVAVAHDAHVVVRLRDGTVREGNLRSATPMRDPGIAGAVEIGAQSCTACARGDDGVRCWAIEGCIRGLFDDDPLASPQPHLVEGLADVRTIAVGARFVCGLLTDGSVACAGSNHWGQLGDGTFSSRGRAERIEGLSNVSSLAAGSSHVCALSSSGRLVCWGNVQWGQLGDARLLANVTSPVRVYGLPMRSSYDPR
jgi:hypothetical protein